MAQAIRYSGWQEIALSAGLRRGVQAVTALLIVQIALGGWVSTNYAVLACQDFPLCQGSWWPQMDWQGFKLWRELGHTAAGELLPFSALVSIHVVHRTMAWLVLAALLLLGWRLLRVPPLTKAARLLLALTLLQLLTGMSNVVLDWPLVAALLHTGGASALLLTLVWMWARSHPQTASLSSAAGVLPAASAKSVA
jgi:cytochrome c oxidase assembly protein subunit 15